MNDWINVKDRLPETEERVLIRYRQGKVKRTFVGEYYPWEERWSSILDAVVTHWMPLPEPPEDN